MKFYLRQFTLAVSLLIVLFIFYGVSAPVRANNAEIIVENDEITQDTPPPPDLSIQERIALALPPRDVTWISDLNRLVHGNQLDWPEMKYLNESTELRGRTVTPVELRIVPAGNSVQAYHPSTGEMINAESILESNVMRDRPSTIDFLFIPPGGSLIMVKIEVRPSVTCTGEVQGPRGNDFRVAYPGFGEQELAYKPSIRFIDQLPYEFGEYNSILVDCLNDGWLYFYLPSLEIDPTDLWLEYVSEAPKPTELGFWTLTTRD